MTPFHHPRRRRVLCVDDNPDVADSEADLLVAYGFNARACYDGPTVLVMAAGFDPDVCLIDLQMPGMDGDELAVRLKEQVGQAPLVLVAITAMNDEKSRRRIAAAGFDLHLVKPVEPGVLVGTLTSLARG